MAVLRKEKELEMYKQRQQQMDRMVHLLTLQLEKKVIFYLFCYRFHP